MQDTEARARVLLVDDEAAIRAVFSQALRGWGYNVEVAADGDEGIRLLSERRPDVVITDYMMPRVTGLEVIEAARALDPDVVVIMITGYGFGLTPEEVERYGVERVLTKPVLLSRLREVLHQAVEDRRAREARRSA